MRYIIKTEEDGKRLSLEKVSEKRTAVKERLLSVGVQYIEVEALLGSLNAMGQGIEERVYIITDVTDKSYV